MRVSDELPVGRPCGMRVPSQSFRYLPRLAACDEHYPDFPEYADGDLSAIGRNGRVLRAMIYSNDSRFLRGGFRPGEAYRAKRCNHYKRNEKSALHPSTFIASHQLRPLPTIYSGSAPTSASTSSRA